MPATLEALPVELVERIVTSLTIPESGLLRLTNRELRTKASQGSYLLLFTHRSVDLTESGLTRLTKILCADANLSRSLRHLDLIGVRYDSRAGEHHPPSHHVWSPPSQVRLHKAVCPSQRKPASVDKRHATRLDSAAFRLAKAQHRWNVESGVYDKLLAKAFSAIKELCTGDGVETLSLGIVVQTGSEQRFTPDALDSKGTATEESFLLATTLDALASSGLTARHFDVFSKTRLCSIGTPELAAYLSKSPKPSIRHFGSQVRSLSLSYSRVTTDSTLNNCCSCNSRKYWNSSNPPACHSHRQPFSDEDELSCAHETSLRTFLSAFPNISTLHLHEFDVVHHYNSNSEYPSTLFATLLTPKPLAFPYLISLTLGGTNVSESNLQILLSTLANLRSLHMRHINLAEGSWTPIFKTITALPNLQQLTLADLFEQKLPSTNPTPGIVPPPPPPPPMPPGVPPFPVMHSPSSSPDSFLPTLLAFRPAGVPKSEMLLGGVFGNNKVEVRGMWIEKLELVYSFVGLAEEPKKAKIEQRWERERIREFGPAVETFHLAFEPVDFEDLDPPPPGIPGLGWSDQDDI